MSLKLERLMVRYLAGGSDEAHHDDEHSSFGVHIQYEDLYQSLVFLAAIYVSGQIAQRVLKMPTLVGEIIAGIILGPSLIDFVPISEAWVLLGEMGLILLVIEAGIDIDLDTLKLIGSRGFLIAVLGSIFPIGIGIALAFALGQETKGAIATGACFGPTSLGIALNILKSGGILNTPVGQLIVAAAVIDDMIALVVLSQLQALTGSITAQGILIPVVSALLFLFVGGAVAIFVLPPIFEKHVLSRVPEQFHGKVELGIMFLMLIGLMPATYYGEASYLMGAFVAGLTFCTSHSLHDAFVGQFKRLLQWLMRIFFAASIGFQVPIKEFGSFKIIWQGLFLTLALIGKLGAGFLVPNFSHTKSFTGTHMRDCLITGFSMAAEGEFAFVIAVFGVDSGLISKELYSSIVLAVLLSTIVPPFLLRFTISYYNRRAEAEVRRAAEMEALRKNDVEQGGDKREDDLRECIASGTAMFFCIQTQSDAAWGLMMTIMQGMRNLNLEVIDHRSWHPRGVKTTLVNEIYVRDNTHFDKELTAKDSEDRIAEVKKALETVIDQPDTARVKVTRWFPGVVNEIVEEVEEKVQKKRTRRTSIQEALLNEATEALERKRALQTSATTGKSLQELVTDVVVPEADLAIDTPSAERRKKRVRHKTRSTPVFGGSLFGEETGHHAPAQTTKTEKTELFKGSGPPKKGPSGTSAELTFNGHTYHVRLNDEALKEIRDHYSGDSIHKRGVALHGVTLATADAPVVNMLQGFVRQMDRNLSRISEHDVHSEHEHESQTEQTEEQAAEKPKA
mmetsp:Transcript_19429/g.45207  ORF Transcript_19429/g.45207 Transcript_19429/m.45207 type:complete len:791 (-) Transcript_19429:359-2731(-)